MRNYQRSKFTEAAAHIGQGIQAVAVKLERLTRLARNQSLFSDPTNDIAQLRFAVKEDITSLNTDIDRLAQWMQNNMQKMGGNRSHSSQHSARDASPCSHSSAKWRSIGASLALCL